MSSTERIERPDPRPGQATRAQAVPGDAAAAAAAQNAVDRAQDQLDAIDRVMGTFTLQDVRNSGGE